MSFFLKRGTTLAIFMLAGTIPDSRDRLMMIVRGSVMEAEMFFIIFIDKPSWPELLLFAALIIILFVSSLVIGENVKLCAILSDNN